MSSDNGLHDLNHLWNGIVERMMGVLGMYLEQRWLYSCLFSGTGWEEVKYCWKRCSSNFSFQNKFIIVVCNLLSCSPVYDV
jgi:hypothetical protein